MGEVNENGRGQGDGSVSGDGQSQDQGWTAPESAPTDGHPVDPPASDSDSVDTGLVDTDLVDTEQTIDRPLQASAPDVPPAVPQPAEPAQSYQQPAYTQPAEPYAQPAQAYATQQPYVQQSGQPEQQPPAEKKKRTGLIAGIVSGGVLVILIIVGVVVFALQSAAHTPQKAVDAYLGAIVHGDVKQSLELGGVKATSSDLLLTNAAYRAATNHISHYSLSGAVTNGDGAAVTAKITQGSEHYTQSFALVKHGKDMLFFDNWELKPVALGRATVDIDAPSDAKFSVASVAIKDGTGSLRLKALPGTYAVKMTSSNELYDAKATSAEVVGFTGAASKSARVEATLTDTGMTSAIAAVNTYLDGCAASTDFRPAGCSFGSTGENPAYTYSNQKWTVDPRPEFTIGTWVGTGWAVRTTTPGTANFSANISDGAGSSGTATAGPIDVRVSGYISKIDSSGATFKSLILDDPTA